MHNNPSKYLESLTHDATSYPNTAVITSNLTTSEYDSLGLTSEEI